MRVSTLLAFSTVAVTIPGTLGGLITYGICQTGEWTPPPPPFVLLSARDALIICRLKRMQLACRRVLCSSWSAIWHGRSGSGGPCDYSGL